MVADQSLLIIEYPASYKTIKLKNETLEIKQNDFYLIHTEPAINEQDRKLFNQLTDIIGGGVGKCQPLTKRFPPLHSIPADDPISYLKQNSLRHKIIRLPCVGTHSPWSSKAGDILSELFPCLNYHIEKGTLFEKLNDTNEYYQPTDYDFMTEEMLSLIDIPTYFTDSEDINIKRDDPVIDNLPKINEAWGLELSGEEIAYLKNYYIKEGRNPTHAELIAFAQLNSEHCRHKVFNSQLTLNGHAKPDSLFSLIKRTDHLVPSISAYKDNAAIFSGHPSIQEFDALPQTYGTYHSSKKQTNLVFKAETHNHPTFVSPFPGAATGVGGEIRDELACGRGAVSKASFVGFSVSELVLEEGKPQPWEKGIPTPIGKASGLAIMLQAPLGGSNYSNEYGRPILAGYFRTLCYKVKDGIYFGYHKPIMLAGGWGAIDKSQVDKQITDPITHLVVIGEPALCIGMSGSTASSRPGQQLLDYASVQRDNAEMERRCAEVIRQCVLLGKDNPIQFIHDLGAGGIGNAITEVLNDNDCGGEILVDRIPIADKTMGASEIWNNESQERFILAISKTNLELFGDICERENVPYGVIGQVNQSHPPRLVVKHNNQENDPRNYPINLPLKVLFPDHPLKRADTYHEQQPQQAKASPSTNKLPKHAKQVLRLPSVAAKSFLITIGDRSIGGMTVREPLIGPWQQPVGDYAATMADYESYGGEICALGERGPVAVINPKAAARLALGEVITNLAASGITNISDIRLCANWMASVDDEGQLHHLYESVYTVTQEVCQTLKLAIPVGKDSLFMRAEWKDTDTDKKHQVISPISLVMSCLAPIEDLRYGITPQLEETGELWLVSLRSKSSRLGGSAFKQSIDDWDGDTADLDDPLKLKDFFSLISQLTRQQLITAYHDCSDGGSWASLCEMAFTSNCGLHITLDNLMKKEEDIYHALFNEELGAIVQVKAGAESDFQQLTKDYKLADHIWYIAKPVKENSIHIQHQGRTLLEEPMTELRSIWHSLSDKMRQRRDNPECVKQEAALQRQQEYGGLQEKLSFDLEQKYRSIKSLNNTKPKIAILRTQGINGQREMAAAFTRAGFSADDVHINDLLNHRDRGLKDYKGLALCGGFSFGDALGAGTGWAASILLNPYLRDQFTTFFERKDTFTLGVCNGCQTLAKMDEIIPTADWQCDFLPNESQRFESRTIMVKIPPSPSILLEGMEGSLLPVASAHGEGRAAFHHSTHADKIIKNNQVAMFYANNQNQPTQEYPFNPNGSTKAIAGLTSEDGRITLMMPHPERVFRRLAQTWKRLEVNKMTKASEDLVRDSSPWFAMFLNARKWVG